MSLPRYDNKNSGYLTLISVLIVGAVGVAVSVGLLLLGVDATRGAFTFRQSMQAKALVNACLEEALQQIRDSSTYTGTGTLTLGSGTCSYSATGTTAHTITATGTVGTVVRKGEITITTPATLLNPSVWLDVADFF